MQFGLGHVELHDVGLEDGEDVLGGPVEGEGGGETVAEEEEHEGHQHEDALLHFVGRCGLGGDLHLKEHGDAHDDGEGVDVEAGPLGDGVGHGEVGDPEEVLAAEFGGVLEDTEEAKEDGDLQEHGEATTEGVDSVVAVELHHFLLLFGRIVFVFFLKLFHERGDEAHALHGVL